VDDDLPLVIGYGNPLRGDDGVGAVVAQRVKAELGEAVELIVAHGLTPEVALMVSRATRVVFIDARCGLPTGVINVEAVTPEDPATATWSVGHFLAPSQILAMAGALYGNCPPAALVTIGGENWEPGDVVSRAVNLAIPEAVRAVVQELQRELLHTAGHRRR
jgi:hydrogenase maturation protease